MASGDGGNGLAFFQRGPGENQIDPRVPVDSAGFGTGTDLPLYAQGVYSQPGSDIRLGSGIEARLIEAEAALDGGASGAYVAILNDLRATVPGLDPLDDPGDAEARVRQLFAERAHWLWLTGHRLGDQRRMVRQYGFAESDVFPAGQTVFGAQRGTDVNFPIPEVESNNPQYAGDCLDRGA